MTGILQSAFVTVDQLTVLRDVLHNHVQLGTIEHIQHLVQADVDGLLQEGRLQKVLNLQRYVAQNHRQSEVLHGTCPRSGLAPTILRVIATCEHDVERLLCYVGIFGIARSLVQLTEGYHSKGVGEDVVRLHQRMSFAIQREVPVQVAVVTVFLQELSTLYGRIQPLLTSL